MSLYANLLVTLGLVEKSLQIHSAPATQALVFNRTGSPGPLPPSFPSMHTGREEGGGLSTQRRWKMSASLCAHEGPILNVYLEIPELDLSTFWRNVS